MDRYFEAAPAGSAPTAPAANPGYPTNGNPGAAVPAAEPGEWWFHMVTEEMRAVITSAGLTPSHTNLSQLSLAIAALVQAGQRTVVLSPATFAAGVANGNVVYWDSAASKFDKALADGSAKQNAMGVADVTNSKVIAFGDAAGLFSGLTPGGRYYLDGTTAGAITTTAPANAVYIVIAKTATEVFVDIDALGVRTDQANAFTAGQAGTPKPFPATSGTVTLDLSQSNNWEVTLTGNIVLANPSTMPLGQSGVIRVINGASPYTIAYGSYFKSTVGTLPALTSTANAVDLLPYYVESATRIWIGAQGDSK